MKNINKAEESLINIGEYMYEKHSLFESNKILSAVKNKIIKVSNSSISKVMKEDVVKQYVIMMIMNVEMSISESLNEPISKMTRYSSSIHEPIESVPFIYLEASKVLNDLERILVEEESVDSVLDYQYV